MRINKIDGINYVQRVIPTKEGPKTLEGITVRALRRCLESADADAMVVYAAEQGDGLLFGCIGGAANGEPELGLCFLVGPEVSKALKHLEAPDPADTAAGDLNCPLPPHVVPPAGTSPAKDIGGGDPDSETAPPVDRSQRATTDGKPPVDPNAPGAPGPIGPDGQHSQYWVLSEEERKKGWVRPYRDCYIHQGQAICGRNLGPHDTSLVPSWTVCAGSPGHDGPCGHEGGQRVFIAPKAKLERLQSTGFFGGCGVETKMGRALSETYARDPSFYGSTYCVACKSHFDVAEFIWSKDGQEVGS